MALFRYPPRSVARRLWLAMALACGIAATAAVQAALPPSTGHPLDAVAVEGWLDGMIPFAMKRGEIAGAVVVVVKDGQILLQKGYGDADVAGYKPVDPASTMFRLGSISKLFTWTAVMQQVERGKIDLDADINRYLDFRIPPFGGKPVTMRNLMTHTAGFEETGKSLIAYDPHDALTLDQYIHKIRPQRIFAPGTISAYSNYGVALAGYIVQRVSGERYEGYIKAHILDPLGMRHTSFRQPLPAMLVPDLSKGYARASGAPKTFEYVNAGPAGAGSTSGTDIARFMVAHLQDGAMGAARILSPQSAEQMHNSPLTVISPDLHRMTLGFFELDRNGHHIIGHGGDTAWFHSNLWLWPNDKVGVFLVVNSLGKGSTVSVLRTLLFEQFADRFLPGPAPQGSIDPATARAHAAMIAKGQYVGSRRVETSFLAFQNLFSQGGVSADHDGLISVPELAFLTGTVRKYREIAPFVWREVNGKSRLAAKVVDNRVVAFSEDNISPALTQMRPSPWKDAHWLLPAYFASLAVLAITVAAWAVGAAARHYYHKPLAMAGAVTESYLATRAFVLAALLLMGGWIWLIFHVPSRTHFAAIFVDPAVLVLTALSFVLFPGALIVAVIHASRAWTAHVGRLNSLTRLWDALVIAACFILVWVAIAFHLIGTSLAY